MKVTIVVESLGEVKNIFDDNRIDFWLDSGTLLGAVRDGKIIEWDNDIDLGTWNRNATKIISAFPDFKRKGSNVVLNKKQAVMTVERLDSKINIVLYREKGNYAWTVWILESKKKIGKILKRCLNISNLRVYPRKERTFARKIKYFSSLLPSFLKQLVTDMGWRVLYRFGHIVPVVIPKYHFEKLSTIKFYGMQFKIPSDVKKYLEYRYGSDWKTPNKKWIYYKDDSAIAPHWDVIHFKT